jgi:hypothetical protein
MSVLIVNLLIVTVIGLAFFFLAAGEPGQLDE